MPKFKPGTLVLMKTSQHEPEYVGVIIEESFFKEVMGSEKLEWPEKFSPDDHCAFRIFGVFVGSGLAVLRKDPELKDQVSIHYGFEKNQFVEAVDLRGIAGIPEEILRIFIENEGALLALNDVRVLYEYLDGKRFEGNAVEGFLTRKEKLLQLFERAIPDALIEEDLDSAVASMERINKALKKFDMEQQAMESSPEVLAAKQEAASALYSV